MLRAVRVRSNYELPPRHQCRVGMGQGTPQFRRRRLVGGGREDRVFTSVVTLAELRYGIERLAASSRRQRLDEWLRGELPLRFEGRLLPVDGSVADAWGTV